MRTMRRALILTSIAILLLAAPAQAATSSTRATGKGKNGQVLVVSRAKNLNPTGQWVTVSGRGYNETVGIYVTYCKVVPTGQLATPCGAGIDMTGKTHTSVWVSSNAPFFARPLITEYRPGGKFSVRIRVVAKIGDLDCTKYKCAITTRSDHLNLDTHKNDVFIPITFAKKGTS